MGQIKALYYDIMEARIEQEVVEATSKIIKHEGLARSYWGTREHLMRRARSFDFSVYISEVDSDMKNWNMTILQASVDFLQSYIPNKETRDAIMETMDPKSGFLFLP